MTPLFDPGKNIIAMLGLQELSEDKRVAILGKAVELVEARVTARILGKLDAPAAAEAEKIKDDGEKLAAFFATHVPDLAAITEEEIDRVRGELAEVVAAMK